MIPYPVFFRDIPIKCLVQVLWLFGPPAAGKSTLASERTSELFGSNDFVCVDGDEPRGVSTVHLGTGGNLVGATLWYHWKTIGKP